MATMHSTVYGTDDTYTYDGDGQRVEKASGTLYWYGSSGQVLAESDLSGNITDEYIFFDGRRIARVDAQGNADYYFTDFLGSTGVVADSSGNILDDCDYMPYGEMNCVTSSSGNHYLFTGLEHDQLSGLDHTLNRQYASNYGRWLSPDPGGVKVVNLQDPQTWNMYAYVHDNPASLADPTGLEGCGGPMAALFVGPGGTSMDTAYSSACSGRNANPNNQKLKDSQEKAKNTKLHYVTVYLVKGAGGNIAGHSALQVDKGTVYGLTQAHECVHCALEGKTEPGKLENDSKRTFLDHATLPITAGQATGLQAALAKALKSAPNYNLYNKSCGENCAGFVEHLLRSVGVQNVPTTISPVNLVRELKGEKPEDVPVE